MKRRTRYAILLAVLLAGGFAVLLYQEMATTIRISSPSATDTNPNSSSSSFTTARYTVDSPATGQWLVVQATYPIISVSASDTGTIPAYRSLASLNQTSIGDECSHLAGNGVCDSFEYVQQTGWFWDSANRVLTVHYLGGANVTLTVIEQP